MTDPHVQAIATLREHIDAYDSIWNDAPGGRQAAALRDALAILERPQALEGTELAEAIETLGWALDADVPVDRRSTEQEYIDAYNKIVATISDLQRRLGKADQRADELCREVTHRKFKQAKANERADVAESALAAAREENGKLRYALEHARSLIATEYGDLLDSVCVMRGGKPDLSTVDPPAKSDVERYQRTLTLIRAALASTASHETPTPERDVFVRGPTGPREGVRTEPSALRSGTPPAGGGTVVTEAMTQAAIAVFRREMGIHDGVHLVAEWLAPEAVHDTVAAALRAALVLQQPPAGWKLVPIEPTEAMLSEGYELYRRRVHPRGIWLAMLAVAVAPPPAGGVE